MVKILEPRFFEIKSVTYQLLSEGLDRMKSALDRLS